MPQLQMAEKTAARQTAAALKAAEAAAAAQQRLVLENTLKSEKAAVKDAKQRLLEQQKQEVSCWCGHKCTSTSFDNVSFQQWQLPTDPESQTAMLLYVGSWQEAAV